MLSKEFSGAEVKKHFSDILSRVACGEQIMILKRGKPLAMLVPPRQVPEDEHLAQVKGWLEEDDLFFEIIDQISRNRTKHFPRVVKSFKR